MSLMPSTSLLEDTLRAVPRRYRLPPIAQAPGRASESNPATSLAIVIELARDAIEQGKLPDAALKRGFLTALAQMIQEAMRAEAGDPVFQAMVLRHQDKRVREYASLAAHAGQDRRMVRSAVNAIAHPAKQQQIPPGPQREASAQLHAWASSESWSKIHDALPQLLAGQEGAGGPFFERGLRRLRDGAALERLRRLDALGSDDLVRRYQSLWDRNGPRSGSTAAAARGSASHQRGAAVEAQAMHALQVLAVRLAEAEGGMGSYRVVTSMRVPASIPASHERAKTEWDVVLLRKGTADGATTSWDVCLLVEAKASVDAAATDLPRLLRGLRLLAHADDGDVYAFKTQQGMVALRGASLAALDGDGMTLASRVLYCCDAAADSAPRLLSAASRMQLLSAPASVEFASRIAADQQAGAEGLEPVWDELLASPRWSPVLHQYAMLRQARELMVHTDDLLAMTESPIGGSMSARM